MADLRIRAVLITLLIAFGLAPSAHADLVYYVVDRSLFDRICVKLDLRDDQTRLAAAFFEDYQQKITGLRKRLLAETAEARAESTRLHELNLKALDSKTHLTEADLPWVNELEQQTFAAQLPFDHEVLLAIASGYVEAGKYLQEWLDDLRVVLDHDQQATMPSVERMIRRWLFLMNDSEHRGDFAIIDLVEFVPVVWAELRSAGALDSDLRDDETVRDLLLQYEVDLDHLLIRALAEKGRPPDEREIFPGLPVTSRRQRALDRKAHDWYRLHALTWRIATLIRDHLDQRTPDLGRLFFERFLAEMFPRIFADSWVDEGERWLADQPGINDEQRWPIEHFLASTQRRLDVLRRAAVSAGVEARRKHYAEFGLQPEQLDYVRALLDIRSFLTGQVEAFLALLGPDERQSFADRITDPKTGDYQQYRFFGPWVPSHLAEKARDH